MSRRHNRGKKTKKKEKYCPITMECQDISDFCVRNVASFNTQMEEWWDNLPEDVELSEEDYDAIRNTGLALFFAQIYKEGLASGIEKGRGEFTHYEDLKPTKQEKGQR